MSTARKEFPHILTKALRRTYETQLFSETVEALTNAGSVLESHNRGQEWTTILGVGSGDIPKQVAHFIAIGWILHIEANDGCSDRVGTVWPAFAVDTNLELLGC